MKSNYKQRLARSFRKIKEDKEFKGGLIDRQMAEEEEEKEKKEEVKEEKVKWALEFLNFV